MRPLWSGGILPNFATFHKNMNTFFEYLSFSSEKIGTDLPLSFLLLLCLPFILENKWKRFRRGWQTDLSHFARLLKMRLFNFFYILALFSNGKQKRRSPRRSQGRRRRAQGSFTFLRASCRGYFLFCPNKNLKDSIFYTKNNVCKNHLKLFKYLFWGKS